MYGSNVGALNVYVQTGAAIPSTPTWKRTGTQGTHWLMGQFSVNVKTPFNVVIEGVRGNGYRGDIAIDDVNITNGSCSAGTTVGPSSKPAADKCNFEASNLCGFSQDHSDKFDWSRTTGSTSSRGTGPSSDHTYGTRLGHYMYIETSSPRRPNDVARLNSFILTGPTSPTCLTFWYHMYGNSIGTLNVYVTRNGAKGSPIWQMSGNQGNSWNVAEVSIKTVSGSTPYQIVFEGIVGRTYLGDIAIDDFSVTAGSCSASVNCNFDSGLCSWRNDKTDKFDWTLNKGTTGSGGTGPTTDHTSGHGEYVFIEASSPRINGDNAQLISANIPASNTTCFHFYYHMYGTAVGTLRVWYKESGAYPVPIWEQAGSKGNAWQKGQITIPTSKRDFQIIVEGVRGSSWSGDIGLDDVSIDNATSCPMIPNTAKPTVTMSPPPSVITTTTWRQPPPTSALPTPMIGQFHFCTIL
ncbi:MAM and LDL-receptor class A domain-containing protein 1-like [Haliotis asinina]|uniref:MAM and LDL-receptor class A domain-containing protein 1-like n=1 Tax=Haliotis asinina TaxID=109174 RepID=UPI003531ED0F